MNFLHTKLGNRLTHERVNKLQYIYINQRTIGKMGVHELAELDLLELEDNWVEKSQATVLEGGNDGEEEGFEDITWIDDVIEIEEVDI